MPPATPLVQSQASLNRSHLPAEHTLGNPLACEGLLSSYLPTEAMFSASILESLDAD